MSEYEDPRHDGRFPATGPVDAWHADKREPSAVAAAGLSLSEGGVVWVASGPEIAELHASQYEVRSLARLRVDAQDLYFERSHGELHLFYVLASAHVALLDVCAWSSDSR